MYLNSILLLIFVSCSGKLTAPKSQKDFMSVKWAKNLDPVYESGNLPIGFASPLVYESILYIGDLDGKMHAYDLESGREIWAHYEKAPIVGGASYFSEMVIYGTQSGRVYARNYLDGKLIYAIDLGTPLESAPVIYQGRMFFHTRSHSIISLDAATGKVFWNYKRSISANSTLQKVSRPLPFGNSIIVGFADGHVGAISIEEGVVLWDTPITSNIKFIDVDVKPIFYQGRIVIGSANGPMHFINPQTGMIERSVEVVIGHAPIKINGNLYVGTVEGEVAIINKQAKIVRIRKLIKKGISSLRWWKEKVVAMGLDGKILVLDPKTLEIDHTHQLGSDYSSVFGEPALYDKYLAVYSGRNRLYVFQ